MARHGMDNPNYKHGGYCGEFWRGNDPMDNLQHRFALQAKLTELLDMDLTKKNMTLVEQDWVMKVIQAWPEWSRGILLAHGFKQPRAGV